MNPITLLLSTVFLLAGVAAAGLINVYLAIPLFIIALLIVMSVKVANVWEKYVILRIGKLQSVKGAGLFMIIPVLDTVVAIIDERIQTTTFNAEQALTKDTVPVNVDAICCRKRSFRGPGHAAQDRSVDPSHHRKTSWDTKASQLMSISVR